MVSGRLRSGSRLDLRMPSPGPQGPRAESFCLSSSSTHIPRLIHVYPRAQAVTVIEIEILEIGEKTEPAETAATSATAAPAVRASALRGSATRATGGTVVSGTQRP